MTRDEIRREIAFAEGGIVAIECIAERRDWGSKSWWPKPTVQRLDELKARAKWLRAELRRVTTAELAA